MDVQVVGYRPRTSEPAALVLATDGDVRRERLEPGTELDYALGERHCAGVVDEGTHRPCDAARAPRCDRHIDRWPCARCTGDCDLPLASCREEHAVYLAGFAPDAFKVGVTRSWRLERRLREQGADTAAHLRTVADGRAARRIEADMAATVGDSVRVATKVRGLGADLDEAAWDALLAEHDPLETFAFDYGLSLDERPVAETLARGSVVGTKGRILLLANAGTVYAVDLRDLVGYELSASSGDRRLQSSLGAFD